MFVNLKSSNTVTSSSGARDGGQGKEQFSNLSNISFYTTKSIKDKRSITPSKTFKADHSLYPLPKVSLVPISKSPMIASKSTTCLSSTPKLCNYSFKKIQESLLNKSKNLQSPNTSPPKSLQNKSVIVSSKKLHLKTYNSTSFNKRGKFQ